jgi:hypothetical protein
MAADAKSAAFSLPLWLHSALLEPASASSILNVRDEPFTKNGHTRDNGKRARSYAAFT